MIFKKIKYKILNNLLDSKFTTVKKEIIDYFKFKNFYEKTFVFYNN